MTLFVLTQRSGFSAVLTIATLACWWYLADYYLVQLLPHGYAEWVDTSWLDFVSTLVPSGLLLAIFSGITSLQVSKRLRQDEGEVVAEQDPAPLSADALRTMLLFMVPRHQGIAQRYVFWLQGNLTGARSWLCASWILILWLFLALPPLHGYVMERVATFISRTPPYFCCLPHELARAPDEIFNVRNRVRDFEGNKFATYRLSQPVGTRQWYMPPEARADTAIKESGTLLVYAGDFPHMHRRIDVRCVLPDCGFPGLPPQTTKLLPVRAGEAEIDFVQSPRGTHLNAGLVLLTHSGTQLDWAVVEPRDDSKGSK